MKNNLMIGLAVLLLIGSAFSVKKAFDNKKSEPVVAQLDPFIYDQIPLAPGQTSSLVRLETPGTDGRKDRFFCSGSVISPTLVLTAAHCVMQGGAYEMPTMNPDIILIKSEKIKGKKQVIAAGIAYRANGRADYAVVRGDFRKFNIAPITTSNTLMYNLSQNLVACGFPWGAEKHVCYPLVKRQNGKLMKSFAFGFDGFLYPGMSGGPVVDRASGLVFAVNSAVDPENDELVLVPLIGLPELINGDRE